MAEEIPALQDEKMNNQSGLVVLTCMMIFPVITAVVGIGYLIYRIVRRKKKRKE